MLPSFSWSNFPQDARSGPFGPNAQAVYRYIRANLPEDAVVEAQKPRALMLMTGRRGVIYVKTFPETEAAGYYLVRLTKGKTTVPLDAIVAGNPDRFVELFSNSEFRLYRMVGSPP